MLDSIVMSLDVKNLMNGNDVNMLSVIVFYNFKSHSYVIFQKYHCNHKKYLCVIFLSLFSRKNQRVQADMRILTSIPNYYFSGFLMKATR